MIPRAPDALREGFSKWIDDFNEIRGLFSEMLEEGGPVDDLKYCGCFHRGGMDDREGG